MVTHGDKGVETFCMGQVIGKVMGHPKKGKAIPRKFNTPQTKPWFSIVPYCTYYFCFILGTRIRVFLLGKDYIGTVNDLKICGNLWSPIPIGGAGELRLKCALSTVERKA